MIESTVPHQWKNSREPQRTTGSGCQRSAEVEVRDPEPYIQSCDSSCWMLGPLAFKFQSPLLRSEEFSTRGLELSATEVHQAQTWCCLVEISTHGDPKNPKPTGNNVSLRTLPASISILNSKSSTILVTLSVLPQFLWISLILPSCHPGTSLALCSPFLPRHFLMCLLPECCTSNL